MALVSISSLDFKKQILNECISKLLTRVASKRFKTFLLISNKNDIIKVPISRIAFTKWIYVHSGR